MSGSEDVLSVTVSTDSEFSGFSPLSPISESEPPHTPKLRKRASKKKKDEQKKSKKDGKKDCNPKKKQDKGKDKENSSEGLFSKLTDTDIRNLRGLLGLQPPQQEEFDEYDPEWENPLPLRVQVNAGDISDEQEEQFDCPNQSLKQGFRDALGGEEEWGLPKDDSKEKGKPVSPSLARMINTACTTQCDVQGVLRTNKVPENCDRASPPLVNPEVWRVMDRKARSQDRILFDTQSLVAGAISPIARLADVLKTEIAANAEAKALISDALTCLGQTQYKLSLRRRYAIRPSMKNKYASLCSMNMPVTNFLFGDDIGKEIKACDSFSYIGKDQNRVPTPRGRGYSRFPRRGYHYGNTGQGQAATGYGTGSYGQRYQPYSSRGQRGSLRGYQIPKKTGPTATVTAPNEKA